MITEINTVIEQKEGFSGIGEIARVATHIPLVSLKLAKVSRDYPPEYYRWAKPEKTMTFSFAALETFSPLTVGSVHKLDLDLPAAIAFKYLAVKWDDGIDGKTTYIAEDESMWRVSMNLLEQNPHIPGNKKVFLLDGLNEAKTGYQSAELQLKEIEESSLDPDELLAKTIELREKSFGRIARAMTRIFTRGQQYPGLESKMAGITLALGVVDGMMDLKEDKQNHTMTEARASLMVDKKHGFPLGTTALKLASFYVSQNF